MIAEQQAAEFPLAHREVNEPDAATLARLAGEERAVVLERPAKDVEEL